MPDYDLGRAEGTITVKYDGSGIVQANKGLDDFQSRTRRVQGDLQDVAKTTGIAAAALAAGIGLAVNAAIDFEARLSAIAAVSGATTDELEQLRKKALQLGAETAFSASEAALAMEELVKAGLSVEDVLNGAADATVALAAAGEVELAEAAAIASNAMNQFGLSAQELPKIADLIAGAANASAIDVRDFGFSMSQAGAVAALVGVNFEDLAAAIALMGNQGIKGSDAGTSLKTMLQNLQPSTEKQIDLMKELGILLEDGTNRFFTQEGRLKSLGEVAGILNEALSGLTDQQKAMALETIFGTDAIRAAAIIASQGAEGFNAMAAAMGEVTAQEVAAERMNNVAGAIEELKGSAETAAILFGSALLPVIRKITESLTGLINKFSELDPRWQELIAFGAVAVTAILGVIAAIATLGAAIAGVVAAIGAIKIGAIIAGVVAAIAAIAAGIKVLYDNSEEFRNLLSRVGSAIKTVFENGLETVRPFIEFIRDKVIPTVKETAAEFIERLQPAFRAIGDFIEGKVVPLFLEVQEKIQGIMPTLIEIGNFLLGAFKTAWTTLGSVLGFIIPIIANIAGVLADILGPVIGFLIDLIPVLWNALKFGVDVIGALIGAVIEVGKWFKSLYDAVVGFFTGASEAGQAGAGFLQGVWDSIVNGVKTAWDFIVGIITGVIDFFANIFSTIWDVIGAPIEAVMGVVVSLFELAWAVITAGWEVFMLGIRTALDKAYQYIVVPLKTAWDAVVEAVKIAWDFLKDTIQAGWNWLVSLWNTVYDTIVPPIKNAWDTVVNAVQTAMDSVREWISKRWNEIKGIWDTIYNTIVPPIKNAWDTVWSTIQNAMDKVRDTVNDKWEQIKAIWQAAVDRVVAIADRVKEFIDKVTGFFNELKAAAQGGTDEFIAFVKGIPGRVLDALANFGSLLYQKGRDLIQGLIDGINSKISAVGDAMSGIMNTITGWLPGSPAEVGPLSGRGYVLYRGQHLSEDFAEGIASSTVDAERAVRALVSKVSSQVPADISLSQNFNAADPAPVGPTSVTYDIDINVPLEDLRSIQDIADLLDLIDRLRNDSRRGLGDEDA